MSEGIEGSVGTADASSSQPAVNQTETSSPASERTFKQSEVDSIVKRVKNEAVDTYRRMQDTQPQYVEQKYGSASLSEPYQPQNRTSLDEGSYRKIAAEEAQRLRDQWVNEAQTKSQEEMAQRTVSNFWQKVNVGKEKYQDWDSVTGDIQYARFPNVVQLMADYVDNAQDVMYELGKDRFKMEILESLAQRSPQDAIKQAKSLSQSIKDNESVSKIRTPNEPLSQLKPSNAGMDNGVMTVTDFRKKYKV